MRLTPCHCDLGKPVLHLCDEGFTPLRHSSCLAVLSLIPNWNCDAVYSVPSASLVLALQGRNEQGGYVRMFLKFSLIHQVKCLLERWVAVQINTHPIYSVVEGSL